jgi:hypothetical protein
MRKLAYTLTIAVMAVLGVLFLLWAGTGLRASVTGAEAQPATAQKAALETISGAILSGGGMGSDQFKKVTEIDPGSYQIVTYRVQVRNPGLLKADWVRLRLTPSDQDVALLTAPVDVGPFGSAEITAQLLTAAGADTKRELSIEYYILGGKMSQAAGWSQGNG